MTMTVNQYPAVMKTSLCQEYVGGKPEWEELVALYGETLLRPLRTTGTNQSFSRRTVDAVLIKAEADGFLNDRGKVDEALAKLRKKRMARQSGG